MSALKHFLFWPVIAFACTGSAKAPANGLLQQAVYCLGVKGFLPHSNASKLGFGYFLDEKSYPKEDVLYVVNYLNSKHSDGTAFTIFLTGATDHPTFNIQNNASFTFSRNRGGSVVFVTPPLGGIWTQEHLIFAIKQIEKQSRVVIAMKDLLSTRPSVTCESYTDAQAK